MARFWLCDVCGTEGVDIDDIDHLQIDMALTTKESGKQQVVAINKEICSVNCATKVQLAMERAVHEACSEKAD